MLKTEDLKTACFKSEDLKYAFMCWEPQPNKYANNKELAAMIAVQQRQTLIMSKCRLCEYALRVCCE